MQASNLDQLGSGLLSVLQNGLQQASEQPERFLDIIEQFADGVPEDVERLWGKIKEAADRPDWLGVMMFLALQIRDAVREPPIEVRVRVPDENWSRALELIYTKSIGPPLNEAQFILSISLGGDETETNGFIIETKNDPSFEKTGDNFTFGAWGKGDGKWHFPLNTSGSGTSASATVGFSVSLAQPILPVGNDKGIGSLNIGIPRIDVMAKVGTDNALKWKVDLSFGTKAEPGLQAKLDPAGFLGDLATIVQIQTINEQYSPKLSFSSQQSPIFDIGHQST